VERESFHQEVSMLLLTVFRRINRHVIKTGEIKDLVITEESGIAKGIRRITAVTGHEAADVERIADDLQAELTSILYLKGKEKESAMKQFSVVGPL
jgi:alanyl-tRNA synthetase